MVFKIARGFIVTTLGILAFKATTKIGGVQKIITEFPIVIFIIMALLLIYKQKFFEVFNIKNKLTQSLLTVGVGIFMFQAVSAMLFVEKFLSWAPFVILIVVVLLFVFMDKILAKLGVKVVEDGN